MIRIRPERAVFGTVATQPAGSLRRSFAVSGARLPPLAAFALPGNSTTMPRFWRFFPLIRNRPPGATTLGLVPHTCTGQQRTEVITGFLAGLPRASAVVGTAAARTSSAAMTGSRRTYELITERTRSGCVFTLLGAVLQRGD